MFEFVRKYHGSVDEPIETIPAMFGVWILASIAAGVLIYYRGGSVDDALAAPLAVMWFGLAQILLVVLWQYRRWGWY